MTCDCYKKLKQWRLKLRQDESVVARTKRIGEMPAMPSFTCCGKVVFISEKVFHETVNLLGLHHVFKGPDDMRLLMETNEFLKVYFTLFSERGKESSIQEAACWRNPPDGGPRRPSHCMTFFEERLEYDEIKRSCIKILQPQRGSNPQPRP